MNFHNILYKLAKIKKNRNSISGAKIQKKNHRRVPTYDKWVGCIFKLLVDATSNYARLFQFCQFSILVWFLLLSIYWHFCQSLRFTKNNALDKCYWSYSNQVVVRYLATDLHTTIFILHLDLQLWPGDCPLKIMILLICSKNKTRLAKF